MAQRETRSGPPAKLIYSAIQSLDGFIEDATGGFDWAVPDAEVHGFINDLERPIGTYLYGRRLYEMMVGWELDPQLAAQSPLMKDFADLWTAADKIVFSTTLAQASTARTTIARDFDPDAIRRLKAASARDISVGGPALATHAFKAGLVDECHLYLVPIVIGRGKPALPTDVQIPLELLDHRRFASGFTYLRYRVRT